MIHLQFVRGTSLTARAIAWWGNGYGGFSHVDALLPDGTLLGARDDAVGGKPPGVQIRPQGYEKWDRKEVVEIATSSQQADVWRSYLRSQIGMQYDKGAIWDFILGRQDLHQAGHWICSALQTGALQAAGLLRRLPVPDQQVSPDALYLLASQL